MLVEQPTFLEIHGEAVRRCLHIKMVLKFNNIYHIKNLNWHHSLPLLLLASVWWDFYFNVGWQIILISCLGSPQKSSEILRPHFEKHWSAIIYPHFWNGEIETCSKLEMGLQLSFTLLSWNQFWCIPYIDLLILCFLLRDRVLAAMTTWVPIRWWTNVESVEGTTQLAGWSQESSSTAWPTLATTK